ncbi:MAG: hypothetical protein ABI609_13755 [Acidobacteriota bacterium]
MKPIAPLLLAALLAAPLAAATSPLPWIEDDYARAVAQAKALKVPLFLEASAPW